MNKFYSGTATKLPISTSCLALFISYLTARKLASATIMSYVSALGYVHKIKGLPDPSKSFLIRKLFAALGRHKPCDLRLPITRQVLHELVNALVHTNSSAWQRKLYSAMYLVAFYGFFRLGELATKGANTVNTVLQFRDIQFVSSGGQVQQVKITIVNYKHNNTKTPHVIVIDRQSTISVCPVNAVVDYCQMRGSQPGPLFCSLDLKPITMAQFNMELRRSLIFCGLDSARYKSHSFRIGAASYAAEQGLSDAQIRALGRWKSEAFKLYIRPSTVTSLS